MNKRLEVLDVFRGFAALMVLVYHLVPNFYIGRFGVQFFFVISGFVIYLTVEKVESPLVFIKKRFVRLYPTYWVCVLITSLVLFIGNVTLKIPSFKVLAINFTMAQELFNVKSIDGAYWSLLAELFFYGFMFFVILAKQKHSYLVWGTIWLVIILANLIFDLESKFLPIKFLNIRHGQLFLSGILFYKIFTGKGNLLHHILIFACYILSLFIYTKQFSYTYIVPSLTLIYILFYLFVNQKLNFLSKVKLFLFFGTISYPLYLLHQEIGLTLLMYLPFSFAIKFSIAFLIIVLLSYLLHIFVEKKSPALLKIIK